MARLKTPTKQDDNPPSSRAYQVYRELVNDATKQDPIYTDLERPLKRPRPNSRTEHTPDMTATGSEPDVNGHIIQEDEATSVAWSMLSDEAQQSFEEDWHDSEEEEGIEFEDVPTWTAKDGLPCIQTSPEVVTAETGFIELKLDSRPVTKHLRRSPPSQADRQRRLCLHKTHVIFLLWHCAQRNHWCNDSEVQRVVRPLLTRKMVKYLNPSLYLPQFDQTESMKAGLLEIGTMFKDRFKLSEKGMRRALWAENHAVVSKFRLPVDMDSCLDKNDFREIAQTMRGSRDVGAQLYCALLRSAGVQARLVCSLQVLCLGSGGPGLSTILDGNTGVTGRKNATSHTVGGNPRLKDEESPIPIFWVEVLDKGHQQWQPVDPIVTRSFWKSRLFEPSASDIYNSLSYVVAFNADGSARDVTRRYANAYTTKTRRQRVEGVDPYGAAWWHRVMCHFQPPQNCESEIDQIEDIELASLEAREPMPRNMADFKGHPVYALERHLRRNEVFVQDAKQVGTISAGPRGSLEPVYRRLDVRIAHGREKWYRLGRVVKPDALINPAKVLPARPYWRTRPRTATSGSGNTKDNKEETNMGLGRRDGLAPMYSVGGDSGKSIFTIEQTELFLPHPVVDGIIPKNRFGNIYAYIPSMVPPGGTHVVGPFAARAAFIIGVDHAPAVTGFRFPGGRAAAVVDGVVVAEEYVDAVNAVIDGLQWLEVETQQAKRSMAALRTWHRFLIALRIHERIWAGVPRDGLAWRDSGLQSREDEESVGVSAMRYGDSACPIDNICNDDCAPCDEPVGGGGFMVE